MTLSYTFDKKEAAKGISRSIAYRTPIRRFLIPVLGLIFLGYSLKYLPSEKSGSDTFGLLLLVLGIFYLILPALVRWRAVKNVFAGRSGDLTVIVATSGDGIEMSAGDTSMKAAWSSFVDVRVCKDGVLLYPQKTIQYWIPSTATVEGGTWRDFEALVSSSIQRKI
jgi:hypothetical protein